MGLGRKEKKMLEALSKKIQTQKPKLIERNSKLLHFHTVYGEVKRPT